MHQQPVKRRSGSKEKAPKPKKIKLDEKEKEKEKTLPPSNATPASETTQSAEGPAPVTSAEKTPSTEVKASEPVAVKVEQVEKS